MVEGADGRSGSHIMLVSGKMKGRLVDTGAE